MWFLLAVAVLANGEESSAVHPDRFATEAECRAVADESAERFKTMPMIKSVNQKCVKVDVPK